MTVIRNVPLMLSMWIHHKHTYTFWILYEILFTCQQLQAWQLRDNLRLYLRNAGTFISRNYDRITSPVMLKHLRESRHNKFFPEHFISTCIYFICLHFTINLYSHNWHAKVTAFMQYTVFYSDWVHCCFIRNVVYEPGTWR